MLGWMESVSLARYAGVSTADTSFANAKIYSMQTQTQIANAGENTRTHANAGRGEDGGCGGGFVTCLSCYLRYLTSNVRSNRKSLVRCPQKPKTYN